MGGAAMSTDHLVWFIIGVCATLGVVLVGAMIAAAIGLTHSPLNDTRYVD